MIERDFGGAQNILRNSPRPALDYLNGGNTPKTLLAGCIQHNQIDFPAQPLVQI